MKSMRTVRDGASHDEDTRSMIRLVMVKSLMKIIMMEDRRSSRKLVV